MSSDPFDSTVYTEQDRIEYDRWMQLLPPEHEPMWHLMRLQIKHDTSGLHASVKGYKAFLDDAEQLVRDLAALPSVITELRRHVDGLADAQARTDRAVAELSHNISERRRMLDERVGLIERRRTPGWAVVLIAVWAVIEAVQALAIIVIIWGWL